MNEEKRSRKILDRLREEYPDAHGSSLDYDGPIQLLVATILSAQSTDEKVNEITSKLFKRYSSAKDFAEADRDELESLIYSSGYYRNKAKWIQETCERIVKDHNSKVPREIDDLVKLEGVGRKTANIVLSDSFGTNQGIPIDTHVKRLTKRLGFSEAENRNKMEQKLMDLIPRDRWYEYATLLVSHGKRFCKARKPKCDECVINDLCPTAFSHG
ncbi:endonuclease III [candidate division MSBL1 archaeon SCGC-AAA259A05]|uniref:Endonuclease III n=1 Tax=candidate division MSBL1 archaeon SCGC-AAA259A05 TaxID=1698259 RepID=A0A133UBY6_9EURY|nr:endonuclease III [candidate division MSBL1 archaeon SCGC-AAA259A05]